MDRVNGYFAEGVGEALHSSVQQRDVITIIRSLTLTLDAVARWMGLNDRDMGTPDRARWMGLNDRDMGTPDWARWMGLNDRDMGTPDWADGSQEEWRGGGKDRREREEGRIEGD